MATVVVWEASTASPNPISVIARSMHQITNEYEQDVIDLASPILSSSDDEDDQSTTPLRRP